MKCPKVIQSLIDDLKKALSLDTLKEQWLDMLRLFGMDKKADKAAEKTVVKDNELHTLHIRFSLKGWTDPDAVCLCTQKKSFSVGNAPQFDIYLDPTKISVGEIYCSVFFDKGINSYVFMLVSGGFNVPIKETDEPYLPGDWSLFASGNREQTDLHNAIRVPVSNPDEPVYVRFNIGGIYYFEAWAHPAVSPITSESDCTPTDENTDAPATETTDAPAAPVTETPAQDAPFEVPVAVIPPVVPTEDAPVEVPAAVIPPVVPAEDAPVETPAAVIPPIVPNMQAPESSQNSDLASLINAALHGSFAASLFASENGTGYTQVVDVPASAADTPSDPGAFAANFASFDSTQDASDGQIVTIHADANAFAANFAPATPQEPIPACATSQNGGDASDDEETD